MQRYIVARIVFGLLLLFAVIFIIIRIASSGSDSSSDNQTPNFSEQESEELSLSEFVDPMSVVQFQKIGKTVAAEEHRELKFTISQNRRKVELIQGYDGKVIASQSLTNTEESYREFLYALEVEGFLEAKSEPKTTDPRGVCSDGRQYHFTLKDEGETKSSLWTTSCSSKNGTLKSNRKSLEDLFEDQFPDLRDITRGETF